MYAQRVARTERENMGYFLPVYQAYVQSFATQHYAKETKKNLRFDLTRLFEFLRQKNIRSLERVTPKLISEFLLERYTSKGKTTAVVIPHLRLFFSWLILEGKRHSPNPVLYGIHGEKRPKRLPRPFSDDEMRKIWEVLEKPEVPLPLRVAVALASECALRIAECCNTSVADIDLVKQQVFVRMSKVKIERIVPFAARSRKYLEEWLEKRGKLPHDFLLTSRYGRPMRAYNLREILNKLLRPAVPKWKFHRLRHFAASALAANGCDATALMKTFGWRSASVAQGYIALAPEQLRSAYDRAMQTRERALAAPATRRSLDEYLCGE